MCSYTYCDGVRSIMPRSRLVVRGIELYVWEREEKPKMMIEWATSTSELKLSVWWRRVSCWGFVFQLRNALIGISSPVSRSLSSSNYILFFLPSLPRSPLPRFFLFFFWLDSVWPLAAHTHYYHFSIARAHSILSFKTTKHCRLFPSSSTLFSLTAASG